MNPQQVGIEIRELTKRLGRSSALDGLSLRLEPGTLTGLIGPDGAGKTTLLRLLMGLLHPDQGTIIFKQGDRPIPFSTVRPSMAYMPQRQSLYPDLTCDEHLAFFRDLYQIPADQYLERREELYRITRLLPFKDRSAGLLSGGMYKKLALMCCLLQSPSVLLLDEPTNGVDPISRREFWDLLYRLRSDGVLVAVSTAYMDEAERCDHVAVMESGRLLAEGEPAAVLASAAAENFDQFFLKRAGEGAVL